MLLQTIRYAFVLGHAELVAYFISCPKFTPSITIFINLILLPNRFKLSAKEYLFSRSILRFLTLGFVAITA